MWTRRGTTAPTAGFVAFAALLLAFAPAGEWAPFEIPTVRGRDYKPADIEAAKLNLQRVHEIFRRDKALDPPAAGVLVEPTGGLGSGVSWSPRQFPYRKDVVPGTYDIIFLHPRQICRGGVCRTDKGEGPGLRVFINMPHTIIPWTEFQSSPLGEPHDPEEMFLAPRQVATVAGFPLYENGYAVMTRRTQPIWVPVTRAEFVRARVDRLRQHLPRDGTPAANAVATRIAALEREAGAMPTAERTMPAYCCGDLRGAPSGLAASPGPPGRLIVRFNRDFFDPSLDAGAIQLLVVGTALAYDRDYSGPTSDHQHPLFADVQAGLDWQALANLLR